MNTGSGYQNDANPCGSGFGSGSGSTTLPFSELVLSVADGRDNIVGSLILAGNYAIPEVCVYFSHKLIRGNRTIKVIENPSCYVR
jgi:hypothetical protein